MPVIVGIVPHQISNGADVGRGAVRIGKHDVLGSWPGFVGRTGRRGHRHLIDIDGTRYDRGIDLDDRSRRKRAAAHRLVPLVSCDVELAIHRIHSQRTRVEGTHVHTVQIRHQQRLRRQGWIGKVHLEDLGIGLVDAIQGAAKDVESRNFRSRRTTRHHVYQLRLGDDGIEHSAGGSVVTLDRGSA